MPVPLSPFEVKEVHRAIDDILYHQGQYARVSSGKDRMPELCLLLANTLQYKSDIGMYATALDVDSRPFFRWLALMDRLMNLAESDPRLNDPSKLFEEVDNVWPDAYAVLQELRFKVTEAGITAVTPDRATGDSPKTNRRKHRQQKSKKLTVKQLEAFQAFAECECNYSHTAKKLGLCISATRERIKAAYKKLGDHVPRKAQTRFLPTDHRGGVSVAAGPKPEPQGLGADRSPHDRRLD